MVRQIPTVMTIAGSDPSGGAGIQSDLKTFAAHGVTGTSVIASLTVQSSQGVRECHDIPPEVVASQITALWEDGRPAAIKTGMLGNAAIVETVARILKRRRARNLVVDPVLRATRGGGLLSRGGLDVLKERLLPLAVLVTPNLREAEALSGRRIRSAADRRQAARLILKTGVRSVLIKGGHGRGRADDWFYGGGKELVLPSPRLAGGPWHGTGCVLAAAVAAHLAKGVGLEEAVAAAKRFLTEALPFCVQTGEGQAGVDPLALLRKEAERYALLERVSRAVQALKENRIGHLIPEVQSNIGCGLAGAQGPGDVIAIPGRIVRDGAGIATLHDPRFGASQHVARIVLTVMRSDPGRRAVMNLKFQQATLDACRRLGFSMASFDRRHEPRHVKQREGSSLEWGTQQAIQECGFVPDVIYDLGGQGKEEMIRVIAPDVESLVQRVLKIHKKVSRAAGPREKDAWRVR